MNTDTTQYDKIISLIAQDQYGRCLATAHFRRTWRYNPATDQRDYGYQLQPSGHGCDFGDITFFFQLPVGQRQGIIESKTSAWVYFDNQRTI
jgi:hypothetical protein